jgi:hypothetical protein
MKNLKRLTLVTTAVMAFTALVASTPASATTLEVGGAAQSKSVGFEMSLGTGTSMILKDKNGTTNQTCTGSSLAGATEGAFTGASVSGPVSKWTFSGCSHKVETLSSGTLSVTWTSGTSGTVTSSAAEVTDVSTVFGVSVICKTGTGTPIGTLTGVKEGNATIHLNATALNCGALGITTWTGTYTVTSPLGLGVVS